MSNNNPKYSSNRVTSKDWNVKNEENKIIVNERFKQDLQQDKTGKGYICPICGSGSGDKGTGITENPKNPYHYTCWAGCFKNCDAFDILALKNGIPTRSKEAMQYAFSLYNVDDKTRSNDKIQSMKETPMKKQVKPATTLDFTEKINRSSSLFVGSKAEKYINNRGISTELAQRFKLGYSESEYFPDKQNHPALIIPVSKSFFISRNIDEKTSDNARFSNVKGSKSTIFNLDAIKQSDRPIFIVEGAIDALSIMEVKGQAIALNSTSNADLLVRQLENLKQLPPFVLCLDNDKAGQKATDTLITALTRLTARFIDGRFIFGECKDANEILMKNKPALARAVTDAEQQALTASAPEPQAEQEQERPPFIEPIYKHGEMVGEKVIPPLLAEYIRNDLNFFYVKDGDFSEVLRFVYRNGFYNLVDDKEFMSIIKNYITEYNRKLLKMTDVKDVLLDLSTDGHYVDAKELDADENIINFKNGILKLDTMTLEPHSPDIKSTIQIDCEWSFEDIETPIYDDYIKTLVDNDSSTIHFLNQYAGVALSNVCGYKMKQSLFLVGEGDSGKSQYKLLLEDMLGNRNCCAIDLKTLERPFALVGLYRKRLAGTADMSYMKISELSNFKNITGGDLLRGEAKGKDAFNFRFNGVLLFCANKKPHFGGDTGDHVYRRMIFVDCPNKIPEEKQDKNLLNKMKLECVGIVRKWVLALKTTIDAGYNYNIPEKSKQILNDFKIENNSVLSFISECVIKRPTSKLDSCTTKKMYDVYKEWCKDNNSGYAEGKQSFKKLFTEHFGYKTPNDAVVRTDNTYYRDYTLSLDAKEEYRHIYRYDSV